MKIGSWLNLSVSKTAGLGALVLLLLLVQTVQPVWAQCTPPPPVPSSVFTSGTPPSYVDQAITISWTRSTNLTCANQENYVVVEGVKVSEVLTPVPTVVLCSASAASSCILSIQTQTTLNANSQFPLSLYFFVLLYYNSANPNNYTVVGSSTTAQLSSCISLPPTPISLLSPVNASIDYVSSSLANTTSTAFTFSWTTVNTTSGFGRFCGQNPTYGYLLVISRNMSNVLQSSPSSTFDYSQSFPENSGGQPLQNTIPIKIGPTSTTPNLQQNGEYYWRVFTTNNGQYAGSLMYSFDLIVAPDPCVPVCVQPVGTCNVSFPFTGGYCICTSGYTGPDCSIAPTSPPNNSTSTPPPGGQNTVGLAVGVSVAGAVVLITIIVVVVYIARERRKAKKDLEMSLIVIQQPEYAILAWKPFSLELDAKVESSKKMAWTKFEQLVLSQDLYVVHSFIAAAKMGQMDNLIAWMICIFCRHQAATQMIESLLLREIETFEISQAGRDASIEGDANPIPFRGDSAATKAFKIYARVTGLPYLFDTLGQILNDFCALLDEEARKSEAVEDVTSDAASTHTETSAFGAPSRRSTFTAASMEVDPSRITSTEDETINRLSLQLICQKLFVKIYRSTSSFPIDLRSLCAKIKEKSTSQESLRNINLNLLLSNLVFLRFINPAVLMPQHHGLVKDEPAASTTRQLVLITKVLQNLASGVEFGKKEQYMIKLNPFIKQNSEKMQGFLTELTNAPSVDSPSNSTASYVAPITDDQFNAALFNMYRFMTQNFDAFAAALAKEASPTRAEAIRVSMVQCMADIGTI